MPIYIYNYLHCHSHLQLFTLSFTFTIIYIVIYILLCLGIFRQKMLAKFLPQHIIRSSSSFFIACLCIFISLVVYFVFVELFYRFSQNYLHDKILGNKIKFWCDLWLIHSNRFCSIYHHVLFSASIVLFLLETQCDFLTHTIFFLNLKRRSQHYSIKKFKWNIIALWY